MHTRKLISRKLLFILCLIVFVDGLGFSSFIPIFINIMPIHETLGAYNGSLDTSHLYSISLSTYYFFMAIASAYFCTKSDINVSENTLLGLSLLLSIFGYVVFIVGIINGSYWSIIVARSILGLSAISQPLSQKIILNSSHGSHRIKLMSLITFSICGGMIVGPLLVKTQIYGLSTYSPIIIILLLSLICLGGIFIYKPEKTAAYAQDNMIDKSRLNLFRQIMTSQGTKYLMLTFFLLQISWSLFYQAFPIILMKSYHFNLAEQNLFLSFLGVGLITPLLHFISKVSEQFESKSMLMYTLFTYVLLIILLVVYVNKTFVFVSAFLLAASLAMAYTTILALFPSEMSHTYGALMGATNVIVALAWGAGALLSNFAFSAKGIVLLIIVASAIGTLSVFFNFSRAVKEGSIS